MEVAESYPTNLKKTLLLHFLNLFQSKQLSHDRIVIILHMLIVPMLAQAFQNGKTWEVIDESIIKTIIEKLLDLPEEHRKELIKFGWNNLKREDGASKQLAFVNVCHFLEAYQTREKITLQVFDALLKTCQTGNKALVNQALDILMPALPRLLPLGDSRMPIWIRYTKKILVEEGHSIPNLVHIRWLIVRHPDIFYSYRAQFVTQMVNSFSRLGLSHNTMAENRRIAIEVARLVVNWEKQRQSDLKKSATSTSNGSTYSEESTKTRKVDRTWLCHVTWIVRATR